MTHKVNNKFVEYKREFLMYVQALRHEQKEEEKLRVRLKPILTLKCKIINQNLLKMLVMRPKRAILWIFSYTSLMCLSGRWML
jgi:hypothetical protein